MSSTTKVGTANVGALAAGASATVTANIGARNAAPAQSLKVAEVMRTVPFWQVFLGLFACGFSMNLLGTHGMPMLMDHGFDALVRVAGLIDAQLCEDRADAVVDRHGGESGQLRDRR